MLGQLTSDRVPISDKKATGKKYGIKLNVANDKTFEQRRIRGVELEMGGERLELS